MSAAADAETNDGLTRRALFRRGGTIAAGATATVTVGSRTVPRFSPIGRAAAAVPLVAIGIIGGAAAVKYATGKTVGEHLLGDDRDYSGYTGADALHSEMTEGALAMKSADERVMTSIENNIANSENVALPKGKIAAVEEMNAGNSESAATDALQTAIDDYFATIEENVITHYQAQLNQMQHFRAEVGSQSNLSLSVFRVHDEEGITANLSEDSTYANYANNYLTDDTSQNCKYADYTLLDGSTISILVMDSSIWISPDPTLVDDTEPRARLAVENYNDGSWIYNFDPLRYINALDAIQSKRDSVNADLSGFVSDVYSAYEPGDIPTEDLVDPVTAATEMNQDYEDRGFQSASAAMLGIPTNAEFSADLEIQSDEASDGVWEVNADIFTAHVPTVDVAGSASISSGVLTLSKEPVADSTYELTTTDGETVEFNAGDLTDNSDGTWEIDLSGDLSTTSTSVDVLLEEDEFHVGNTYQPSNWSDPFYIAYSYEDEVTGDTVADFTEIESEFTIVKVTDSLGNEVDTFSNDSQNNQTADIATLEEELAQIREAQIRMQKEAESGGTTGGTTDDGVSDAVLYGFGALVAAALAAVGLAGNS